MPNHPHNPENEMRCPTCQRWLGRASGVGTVTLRCSQCKAERVFVFAVPESVRVLLEQMAAVVKAMGTKSKGEENENWGLDSNIQRDTNVPA